MTDKNYLITYQVSRDYRTTWQTFNDVIGYSPAEWLLDFMKRMKKTGYTNVVLLNAIEITNDEYFKLERDMER